MDIDPGFKAANTAVRFSLANWRLLLTASAVYSFGRPILYLEHTAIIDGVTPLTRNTFNITLNTLMYRITGRALAGNMISIYLFAVVIIYAALLLKGPEKEASA